MKKFLAEVLVFVFCLMFESVVFADVAADYPIMDYRNSTTLVVASICVGVALILALTAFIIIKLVNKKNKK